ncbi:MAG: hypothetical protein PHS57_04690 [Alphaproteobacteria bacterium]|nr:hypothetical protein [Alphaproteobacteria bacterium]
MVANFANSAPKGGRCHGRCYLKKSKEPEIKNRFIFRRLQGFCKKQSGYSVDSFSTKQEIGDFPLIFLSLRAPQKGAFLSLIERHIAAQKQKREKGKGQKRKHAINPKDSQQHVG